MSPYDPGVPDDQPPPGHRPRRRPWRLLVTSLAAVCCLAAAIVAGTAARADLTRKPTPAELSEAASAALAGRWRSWPAGRIFPADLGYSTNLLTQETASRVGIAPATACPAGLDAVLRHLAASHGCRAALRATYIDQLQGVVYTVGVLAFASSRGAAAFVRGLPQGRPGVTGLRALAFAGTASAVFSDAARQASTSRQQGPYVVLTVAGYADGRPAAATGQQRGPDFTPAAQLAAEIIAPLTVPAVVSCRSRQFSC
jgi:hypothetical protein